MSLVDKTLHDECRPPRNLSDLISGKATTYPNATKAFARGLLPSDAAQRKGFPVATGVLDYFPAALVAIAEVSRRGNDQHNPGQPVHWSRGKSTDQDDTIIRHFLERGGFDTDGVRHSAKLAWRTLALLQLELEAAGAPMARGARYDQPLESPHP